MFTLWVGWGGLRGGRGERGGGGGGGGLFTFEHEIWEGEGSVYIWSLIG